MVEGRDRAQWSHTSALLAVIRGLFDAKANPDQFNPYFQRDRLATLPAPTPGAGMAALRTLVLTGGLSGK